MKKVALIYSGYDKDLNSLEYNREGVAQKLEDFGDWEIKINKPLENEEQFTKDIDGYKDTEIDDLLIYYTGHGRLFNGAFQLQMSEKVGITLDTLYGHIKNNFENHALLPKRIAIVIDACYSGEAVTKTTMQFGTSEILASSLEGMRSFETGFPKGVTSDMSLFSHYFCDAIEKLQSELEEINLKNIQTHINKYVKKQISPRGEVDELGYMPMVIAKGNLKKKKNLANVETIYVRFYPTNESNVYQILVNGQTISFDNKMNQEEIQKKVIDKINSMAIPFTTTKIELILPKELYSEVLPLWREHITPHYETVICSLYKEDMADKWLPQLKIRWNNSFEQSENMSFGHEKVSCRVEDETMQHPEIISVIIDKKVENPKVFDGIDAYYFIALWINECDTQQEYSNLIDVVSKEKLCNVSMSLRDKVVKNPKSCISKLNFMWDNPNDLPKQGRRKE